jgi:hypothetical protein
MFAVLEKVAAILLSYGLPGVIVIVQGYWIWRLHTQLAETQEKRVQDAYRIAETLTSCADALERNTEVLNALLDS